MEICSSGASGDGLSLIYKTENKTYVQEWNEAKEAPPGAKRKKNAGVQLCENASPALPTQISTLPQILSSSLLTVYTSCSCIPFLGRIKVSEIIILL